MAAFKPTLPYTTPLLLHIPTGTTDGKGFKKKNYSEPLQFFASFKTYGGTEVNNNGVISVEDTVNIETWYRPDIKSGCRISLSEFPNRIYEIIGEPENINMRNQFLKFKAKRVKGGA